MDTRVFNRTTVFLFLFVTVLTVYGQAPSKAQDVASKVYKLYSSKTNGQNLLDLGNWLTGVIENQYLLPEVNVTEKGSVTSYKASFTNVSVTGLKPEQIVTIELFLGNPEINITSASTKVNMDGKYMVDGKFTIFPFKANGSFGLEFTNFLIKTRLLSNPGSSQDKVKVTCDAGFGQFGQRYVGLLENSAAAPYSRRVKNNLSHNLFQSVKSKLLSSIESSLKNAYISKGDNVNLDLIYPTSEAQIDQWLNRTRSVIVDKGHDPFSLADYSRNFSNDFRLFKLTGSLEIYNGTINGLSTLTRMGPVKVIYFKDSLIIELSVGFKSLTAAYDWQINVGKSSRTGKITSNITYISTFIRLVQPLQPGSSLNLEIFDVRHLDHIWLDITGIRTWDYLLEVIVNLGTRVIRSRIGEMLSTTLMTIVKDELGKQQLTNL
ncbi:uncharacterized protein LOC107362829 [Tetranychus urticae]|uniref:uncharacterized protein LOC107362829 n=1 Tax=Tetranychus urticae TaxID=32264 RepID=UPI00077BCF97|nr:uncharacterized protein LOC107362829 [Tetranychus urticae]